MISYSTPIEKILKELPEKPLDLKSWILEELVKETYIIFNRSRDIAVCTRCGTEYSPEYFHGKKHNDVVECPYCNSRAEMKAYGKGRKALEENFRLLLPAKRGKSIYFTLYEVTVDFNWDFWPELRFWKSAVYKFNGREATYYKHFPETMYTRGCWKERKNIAIPKLPGIIRNCWGGHRKFETVYIYPADFKDLVRGTVFKYLPLQDFVDYTGHDATALIGYVAAAWKYPAMELLFKAGMKELVWDYASGIKSRHLNIRGKTLQKILRGTAQDVRIISRESMEIRTYDKYSYVKTMTGQRLTGTKLDKAENMIRRLEEDQEIDNKILRDIDWEKVGEYLETYVYNHHQVIHTIEYADHVKMLVALKIPLKSKNLFPKDFEKTHEKLSKEYQIEKDRELREQFDRMSKNLNQIGDNLQNVQIDDLTFTLAQTLDALVEEGKHQHHCVATYAPRVAEGKTLIYFVRKTDEPEKSYYTLEISPEGKLRQCRGLRNCNMTDHVKVAVDVFVKLYSRTIKERKTA